MIQFVEPSTGDMLSVVDRSDIAIRDIVFDGGGLLERGGRGGYPGSRPCVLAEGCRCFTVTGCTFGGFDTAGPLLNVCTDALVADGRAERGRSLLTPDYGLAALGGGHRFTLRDNVAMACDIAVDAADPAITGNDVSGWGFSAEVTSLTTPATSATS